MNPELEKYLKQPTILKLIEEEKYDEILNIMQLDVEYTLALDFCQLLYDVGYDLTQLKTEPEYYKLERALNHTYDIKIVNLNYTALRIDGYGFVDTTLYYGFIYKGKYYNLATEITFPASHKSWDSRFAYASPRIIQDLSSII